MAPLGRADARCRRPRRARARRGRRRACAQAACAPDGRGAGPRACSGARSRGRRRLRSARCTSGRRFGPPILSSCGSFTRSRCGSATACTRATRPRSQATPHSTRCCRTEAAGAAGSSLRRAALSTERASRWPERSTLDALTRAVTLFEAKTGVHNPAYHLELAPRVHVHGVAGGRAIREAFSPPLRSTSTSCGSSSPILLVAHRTRSSGRSRSTERTRRRRRSPSSAVVSRFPVHAASPWRSQVRGSALALAAGALPPAAASRRRAGRRSSAASATSSSPSRPACSATRPSARSRRSTRSSASPSATTGSSSTRRAADGHSFLVDDAGVVYRYDIGSRPEETTEIRLDAALRPRPSHLQAADR